ncbi:MAG: BACON domain-containing protein, partial [Gemmatimonadaceae bacterium]
MTPTPAGTTFTVTGAPGWLTVNVSGTTVTWTAAANGSVNNRSAILNIGGQSFTVTQSGAAGTVTLSATSATAPVAGGSGSVTVTPTPADYSSWTVSSASAWLTASKSGNSVNWTAAANTGAGRTATLTIGGQTFTVTQAGATPG